jgi:hypothetical protein
MDDGRILGSQGQLGDDDVDLAGGGIKQAGIRSCFLGFLVQENVQPLQTVAAKCRGAFVRGERS